MAEKPQEKRGSSRAFRGLALVFLLTFLNLFGVMLTLAALGGLEPWGRWQFLGLFGVIEASAGFSNIIAPNIWHLPVAELQTSRRTPIRLAATTMLIPHWGGAARAAAGVVLIAIAGFSEGWAASSLLLAPLLFALMLLFLGVSAVVARLGVAYPETDTVQFVVRWRGRERDLEPFSITVSIQQFLLGILALPAVKILAPGSLFGPEIRPSTEALLLALVIAVVLLAATAQLWAGRLQWRAPREQQREAELNA